MGSPPAPTPNGHNLAQIIAAEGCLVSLSNRNVIAGPTSVQNPIGCHWLAVYGADGQQTFRSTCEQWETDPVGEMTRIADAATNGRPVLPQLPATRTNGVIVDYGRETAAIVAVTGRAIRWTAAPEKCDYVRITAPAGRELVYWICDEWREDPECVIGALLAWSLSRTEPPGASTLRPTRCAGRPLVRWRRRPT